MNGYPTTDQQTRIKMIETVNATITNADITTADRGFLDCWITLDYGGTCQGFGGYILYLPESFEHHNKMSVAGHFIFRIMEIAGVTDWKELVRKNIRVRKEWSKIHAIGHIIKDDWFNPEECFEQVEKQNHETNI